LVRYLTNDDRSQADKIEEFFNSLSDETTLMINQVVLAELDWVLTQVYSYSKNDFLQVIDQLFNTQKITFINPLIVQKAVRLYAQSKADFSDCYLGAINSNSGCKTTYTFDKQASTLSSFTLLE
jgi:predicted nucleic-acid-binding protein